MSDIKMKSLRERLCDANYANRKPVGEANHIEVPAAGSLDDAIVAGLQLLALRARGGDEEALGTLYSSLAPRLTRIGFLLRPWPNTQELTGIWDRDDVNQEGWLVFHQLLMSWDQHMPFAEYLLSRFGWRLRDSILRGIGKRPLYFGFTRVPRQMLADMLFCDEDEQPEPAVLAQRLLEELVRRLAPADGIHAEEESLVKLLLIRRPPMLEQIIRLPTDDRSLSQIDAA